MEHTFGTDTPVELVVEIASGSVHVEARETSRSTVTVDGSRADEVEVDLRGTTLSVVWPYRTGFSWAAQLRDATCTSVVPAGSGLSAKSESADVTRGRPPGPGPGQERLGRHHAWPRSPATSMSTSGPATSGSGTTAGSCSSAPAPATSSSAGPGAASRCVTGSGDVGSLEDAEAPGPAQDRFR